MEKVYDKCCGIDVHKKLIVACFKNGSKQEIRDFGATTRELLEMADWLKEGGCEMVAMESTASYWKPLYNILETCELKAMVVNARHMKAVPGRKTDVKDAEWIADLLQHGLLTASYIPDKDQRELRELVRYRKSLVGERNRELNRLQKMLEGANIKISGTITDIELTHWFFRSSKDCFCSIKFLIRLLLFCPKKEIVTVSLSPPGRLLFPRFSDFICLVFQNI